MGNKLFDDRFFLDIPREKINEYLGRLGSCSNCLHYINKCTLPIESKRIWKQIYDNGCGALITSMKDRSKYQTYEEKTND